MTPTLVIDCSSVCYAAYYKLGHLSHHAQSTGVIYGFLKSIELYAKKYETGDIVFCWDSNKSIRRDAYPWYKDRESKRADMPEMDRRALRVAKNQFVTLQKEVIPAMGFKNSFQADGYESDDLIASVVMVNEDRDFIIVTNDDDLLQLLDFARIYNMPRKLLLSRGGFVREHGIEPQKWAEVKALAGCTSDTVPGVPGVGKDTARKYIQGKLARGTRRESIMSYAGKKIIERNRWLVTLPLPGTPQCFLEKDDERSSAGFIEMCDKFGMASFLKRENFAWWKKTFKLR